MKICFVASSGGHLEQIMRLTPLMNKYSTVIVTEKTDYQVNDKYKTYYIYQINREFKYVFKLLFNILKSLKILLIEQPDMIISTGALSTVPILILGKLMRKKIIFIESFAKIESPSLTGRLVYKFADLFFVQWESLLKYYPRAIFKGGIY